MEDFRNNWKSEHKQNFRVEIYFSMYVFITSKKKKKILFLVLHGNATILTESYRPSAKPVLYVTDCRIND